MTKQLEAIYQGGVLRPLQPLPLLEDQKVLVTVATIPAKDEEDFLDVEYMKACAQEADPSVTLESVRQILAKIPGSLADDIIAEREERF